MHGASAAGANESTGAIERSHGALRGAATIALCRAAVENQHGCAISFAVLGEELLPLQFGAAEYLTQEASPGCLVQPRVAVEGERSLLARSCRSGLCNVTADIEGRTDMSRTSRDAQRIIADCDCCLPTPVSTPPHGDDGVCYLRLVLRYGRWLRADTPRNAPPWCGWARFVFS